MSSSDSKATPVDSRAWPNFRLNAGVQRRNTGVWANADLLSLGRNARGRLRGRFFTMAQPRNSLPRRAHRLPSSRVELFPPSNPSRLFRGHEVSLYHGFHRACCWAKHRRDQVEIVLFFTQTTYHVGRQAGGKWQELEGCGHQVCLIGAGLRHDCRLDGDTELLVLYVERSLLRRFGQRTIKDVVLLDAAQYDPVILLLISLLRFLCKGRVRPGSRTIDAIGGELACWLVERANKMADGISTGQHLTAGQLDKVMRFIEANMKHDIHVEDLAKQAGLRLSHFTKLFTNAVGCSPYHYLKEIRLLKAYEMLLTGDYLANEVALAVGYLRADHFSEVFRVLFGHTPAEVIKRVRGTSPKSRSPAEKCRESNHAAAGQS